MSQQTIPTMVKTATSQSQGQDVTGRMRFSTQGDASETGGLVRTTSTRRFGLNSQRSSVVRSQDVHMSTTPFSTADHPIMRTNSMSSPQQPTSFNAKRSKATRGAMALLKAIVPRDVSVHESGVEYDWGAERRAALFARDVVQQQHDNPGCDANEYTSQEWVKDMLTSFPRAQWEMSDEEIALWAEKMEEKHRYFVYKPPVLSNGSLISPHPIDRLPYPLSYDKAALQNDRRSYELLKRIYYDLPSIHGLQFTIKPPKIVLDLGCGDGSWILDAAQGWKGTQFYGIDVQRVHPSDEQVMEEYGEDLAKKIKFVTFNFLSDKFPFVDGAFEMVRMANLKWCIPASRWEDVLREVRRVTARGGLIEIIDDDFVAYTAPDNRLTDRQLGSCEALDSQFAEVLHARDLCLNTNDLMIASLNKVFTKFHEDILPVAISPEIGVTHPHKNVRVFSHKDARSSLVRSDIQGKRSSTESQSLGRTRADSNSSEAATLYSQQSVSPTNDVSCFDASSEQPLGSDESHPFPPRPYPLGLVVGDRFIPCSVDEIYAHATKNMQTVLAAGEAIRDFVLPRDPAFTTWEAPSRRGYQQKRVEWKKANAEFEDLLWTYETAMSERLNVEHGIFDLCDSDEEEIPRESEQARPVSTIGQIHKTDLCWNGDVDHIAQVLSSKGLDKLVRVIRVYTVWN